MGEHHDFDSSANKATTKRDGDVTDGAIDAGIEAGSKHAVNALDVIDADQGPMVAMGYAGGMVAGLRTWLVAHHGVQATYELYQRMADDLAADMIGKAKVRQ